MTQEEKSLLLKDLCGRLPYGVMCDRLGHPKKLLGVHPNKKYPLEFDNGEYMPSDYKLEDIKPYLRPMSSMTMEEQREYISVGRSMSPDNPSVLSDWLNEHHFDYRNLIEKGLALEAPDGMYGEKHEKPVEPKRIPTTIEEALDILDDVLTEEDKEYLVENGAISAHFSLGMWIRNEWKLWEPVDSDIKTYLKKEGYEHPDDMSNYIIEEFIKYLNNKL